MPYTEEPKGLGILNNINVTTTGSLVTNFCWLFGSVALTLVDCVLLLRESPAALTLTGLLLTGWGAKTGAGVVDANNKRKADPKYKEVLEAAERGKASGAAAALVLANTAADATTKEHPVPAAVTVKTKGDAEVRVAPPADDKHPTAPTLPVGAVPREIPGQHDIYTDDERGEL